MDEYSCNHIGTYTSVPTPTTITQSRFSLTVLVIIIESRHLRNGGADVPDDEDVHEAHPVLKVDSSIIGLDWIEAIRFVNTRFPS